MIPSLILWHEQDDVTAEFRRQVMDSFCVPSNTRRNSASIWARRSGGSGASAMAISRLAKHDERLASNAQDMFTGHGVRSARKRGLLATRDAAPAYWRAADHKSGVSANTLASGGLGDATTLSRIVKIKSGRPSEPAECSGDGGRAPGILLRLALQASHTGGSHDSENDLGQQDGAHTKIIVRAQRRSQKP